MAPKNHFNPRDWSIFSRSRSGSSRKGKPASTSQEPPRSPSPVAHPVSPTSQTQGSRDQLATNVILKVPTPVPPISSVSPIPPATQPTSLGGQTPNPGSGNLSAGISATQQGPPVGPGSGKVNVAATAPTSPTPNPVDDIFRESLENYKKSLSSEQYKAFLDSKDISATKLISTISDFNQEHSQRSHSRKSAARVQGFLEVADGYLNALGICIQHSPEISSLVVGGLRLFVDLGRRYAGFFDKLNDTMQLLGGHLSYLAKYAELYGHHEDVKKALCSAYGDLLEFCKIACGIFMGEDGKLGENISAVVLLKQLSSPLETKFDAITARFNEHLSNVEKTASILEQERKLLKEQAEAREKSVLDRGKLLSWLSKLEPDDDHERIYAKRQKDTGSWFLESPEVRDWFQNDKSCLLWCNGKRMRPTPHSLTTVADDIPAGTGKSVLTSILVEQIISKYIFDDRIGIAFFYFSFQNEMSQTPTDILSNLIKQLCRHKKVIPEPLKELYKQCTFNDKAPRLSELQSQLESIIGMFEEVFLVIDAMDECNVGYRKQLLPYAVKLFGEASGNRRLKIFVASRPEKDIERILTSSEFETIRVEAKKVDKDIAAYVRHELEHRQHDYCDIQGDQDLRQEIEHALISQSTGMFLWVRCQLDYIYEQPSNEDIQDALKSLPADITVSYQRILDRIRNQPKAMTIVARRALTWVITARRPLSPIELVIAITIEPTSVSCAELQKKYKPQVPIDATCGLLTVEGGFVRPIHFTVQEFLKSSDSGWFIGSEIEANTELARLSIQYLLCSEFATTGNLLSRTGPITDYWFDEMGYIAFFWDDHIRDVPSPLPDDLKSILERFFSSTNRHTVLGARTGSWISKPSVLGFCAAMDLLPTYRQFYPLDDGTTDSHDYKEALRHAATHGSVSAIITLLDLDNAVDCTDGALLYLAAERGHVGAVKLLLDRGSNVNARGEYGTILYKSAENGWRKVVKVLIDHGADIHMKGGYYGTALHAAAYTGYTPVVEELLENGADPNSLCAHYHTALQCAAFRGRTAVAKALIAHGADVNIEGGRYGSALEAAAYGGYTEIVEFLVVSGADVNIQGGECGSALHAATYGDYTHRPRPANDPDVTFQDCNLSSTIQRAATELGTKLVEFLLANGADVNCQVGRYGSALQAAIVGNVHAATIVEILLAHGANVNVHGGSYGSPLQAAIHKGNTRVVELLLLNGAEVDASAGEYDSAITVARRCNRPEIVELLLERGAQDENI